MRNEIILYQSNELAEHIEVKLEDDTVWLTQAQMTLLFKQTKQNISLHINNCFKEGELMPDSVVKESLTTAKDGKKYSTKYYNLDVIISVGYRVKSKQGTQFRIWATHVLRDYLLKGYALNQRMDRIEKSHDRFLIIDRKELYHLGASLKDLGRRWFAFSKMANSLTVLILEKLKKEEAI